MKIMTYSEARTNLKAVMDGVCDDHAPAVVTRTGGRHVVMLSMDEYESMQATLHLLGSGTNARRLRESIAEYRANKVTHRGLIESGKKEDAC